nr:atherin-like [Aegilops tauschii subsp. strangulata]
MTSRPSAAAPPPPHPAAARHPHQIRPHPAPCRCFHATPLPARRGSGCGRSARRRPVRHPVRPTPSATAPQLRPLPGSVRHRPGRTPPPLHRSHRSPMAPKKTPNGKSGFFGMRQKPSGNFGVEFSDAGRRWWIGTYPSAHEAARAYGGVACREASGAPQLPRDRESGESGDACAAGHQDEGDPDEEEDDEEGVDFSEEEEGCDDPEKEEFWAQFRSSDDEE